MKCCTKKNMNRLRIGGIDNILAYIVVSIPLMYLLIMMIGTLYHYAVQSYIAQAVEDTVNNASAYGTLTEAMINDLNNKVVNVTNDTNIRYTLVRKRYVRAVPGGAAAHYDNDGVSDVGVAGLKDEADDTELINPALPATPDNTSTYFRKGDIIGIQLSSTNQSLLGTISNFGLFGGGGSNDMRYTAYKEDIIRNVGADEI